MLQLIKLELIGRLEFPSNVFVGFHLFPLALCICIVVDFLKKVFRRFLVTVSSKPNLLTHCNSPEGIPIFRGDTSFKWGGDRVLCKHTLTGFASAAQLVLNFGILLWFCHSFPIFKFQIIIKCFKSFTILLRLLVFERAWNLSCKDRFIHTVSEGIPDETHPRRSMWQSIWNGWSRSLMIAERLMIAELVGGALCLPCPLPILVALAWDESSISTPLLVIVKLPNLGIWLLPTKARTRSYRRYWTKKQKPRKWQN